MDRLDLNDVHARLARDRGARIVISSDAHSRAAFGALRWGVVVARRAWLEPAHVLNTRPFDEFDGEPPAATPMTELKLLTPDDKLAEIRRLYYATTKQTIQPDLERALELLKSMSSEEERERAAVYMDGLSQMRSDWARQGKERRGRPKKRTPEPEAERSVFLFGAGRGPLFRGNPHRLGDVPVDRQQAEIAGAQP